MQLARMHDIAGLRAVMSTLRGVYRLSDDYLESRFAHSLKATYDYIEHPKTSGYRSIHLVYQCQYKKKPEYNNLLVELQIRSKMQHAWAMAVETMGVYLQSALKSGLGPKEWKDFFAITGSAFARLEGTPPVEKHRDMNKRETFRFLRREVKRLKVREMLAEFAGVTKSIASHRQASSYYLVDLDIKASNTRVVAYARDESHKAMSDYTELERETRQLTHRNVVLVSGGSILDLTKAYPSYFLDTGQFTRYLNRVVGMA